MSDEDKLQTLVSLGFEETVATRALRDSQGDVQAAAATLLTRGPEAFEASVSEETGSINDREHTYASLEEVGLMFGGEKPSRTPRGRSSSGRTISSSSDRTPRSARTPRSSAGRRREKERHSKDKHRDKRDRRDKREKPRRPSSKRSSTGNAHRSSGRVKVVEQLPDSSDDDDVVGASSQPAPTMTASAEPVEDIYAMAPMSRRASQMLIPNSGVIPPPTAPRYRCGNIELFRFKWFHGDISRAQADSILSGKADGTFLVRLSSQPQCYAVAWSTGTAVQTFLVQPRPGGDGYEVAKEEAGRRYSSLMDVVRVYAPRLHSALDRKQCSQFDRELRKWDLAIKKKMESQQGLKEEEVEDD